MQVVLPNHSTRPLSTPPAASRQFFFLHLIGSFLHLSTAFVTYPAHRRPNRSTFITESDRSSQIRQPRDLTTNTLPLGTQCKSVNILKCMVSGLAISFSHSSSVPTQGARLYTSKPPFPFDYQASPSAHLIMEWTDLSRPLERQWLLIDWLGLANTPRPTRWRIDLAWRRQYSSNDPYLLSFTDCSCPKLYIWSLPGGFLVWGTGGPVSGALRIHTLERALSIYRVFELPCTTTV